MNAEEAANFFSDLPKSEKADFLARLAFELTIVARGETYEVGTDDLENPQLMRTINEIQHRILNYLSFLLEQPDKVYFYTDRDFWRMVLESPDKKFRSLMETLVSRASIKFSAVPA